MCRTLSLRSRRAVMSSSDLSTFDREYQALQSGRAVVDLADWSSISVTGADRQAFLHNFCTNDVKRLAPGASCEAFFTNVKGKIVGHGLIHCRENELVIVGMPGQAERLVAHLDRYVIREDVALRDVTAERSYLFVTGDAPIESQAVSMSWPITGRTDSKLREVEASAKLGVVRALAEHGAMLVGQQAFEAARIEAGMPRSGVDFGEENLPQEVSRDRQAISFNKGLLLGARDRGPDRRVGACKPAACRRAVCKRSIAEGGHRAIARRSRNGKSDLARVFAATRWAAWPGDDSA